MKRTLPPFVYAGIARQIMRARQANAKRNSS